MTPERWQRIKHVLDEAIPLDVASRSAYLDRIGTSDPELRSEVEALLSHHQQAGSGFLNQPLIDLQRPLADSSTPLHIGRSVGVYQILEEIGHGGMGTVYRAARVDGQYEKQVAVKLVRSGYDTASVLDRFRNERQILASLDHPNIARLLDGGTTDDGIPYLVMELIEGIPVDEYCGQRLLSVSQRLELFRQVCAAVQFAHQRLVIHRDIKPGNILVTRGGIPKLLDFGIAKIFDPSTASQTTIVHPLTPEYASPEQIRGEPITTATDVYSLGVVLYQLLTGRSPYRVDTHSPTELARAITETEPLRPSTAVVRSDSAPALAYPSVNREGSSAKLRRRLRGDLDNIALKALRKEPQRRYSSVEQLSEDIRRHLEGLPVTARKGSWSYRANKFVRRHKVGMAAIVLVTLAVLGGIVATVREARIAKANEQRAERRFNDTRKLANSLLNEIHDAIQVLPGSTTARKLIVDRALEYLDGLARESAGDPALRRELANAYLRVGQVQGGFPGQPNLGDTAGALSSFRKMLAIRQSLAEAHPDNIEDQVSLAESYHYIADLQAAYLGDVKGGFENCAKAVAIGEALRKAKPDDRGAKVELAADYEKLADIQGGGNGSSANLANFQAGLENHYKTLALAEPMAKEKPDDPVWIGWLADINYKLQNDLVQTGDRVEAMRRARQTAELFGRVAKQENNAVGQRELGTAYSAIAVLLMMDGRFAESLEYSRKQLQLLEPIVAADPGNTEYSMDLPTTRAAIGYSLSWTGHAKEGVDLLRRAVTEIAKLNTSNPNTETRVNLGGIEILLGSVLERKKDWDGALDAYTRALEPFHSLAESDPSDLNDRLKSAGIRIRIATMHLRKGDLESARSGYQEALAVIEPVASGTASSLESIYLEFDGYSGQGDLAAALARRTNNPAQRSKYWEDARTWYRRSLEASRRIPGRAVIDPAGFESQDPQLVSLRLTRCEQALAEQRASEARPKTP